MDSAFKIGDVVRMKGGAGNPLMTVEYVSEVGKCTCVWFVDLELRRDTFPFEVLEKRM